MKWHATGVDYHVSDNTKEYLEQKFHRLEHFAEILEEVKITIARKTHEYCVEANTHFKWGGETIHVEHSERELWPALDHLFDKLDAKLSKDKEKYQDQFKH